MTKLLLKKSFSCLPVPRAAPPFQVMSPSPDTMRVMWEEIDPNDRGGVITRYQLQYRPASNPSAITTHTIDDPSQRSFDVKGPALAGSLYSRG